MIVHAAPPTKWKNPNGQSSLEAIAAISRIPTTATTISPLRGTISKSGRSIAGGGAVSRAIGPGRDCYIGRQGKRYC